MKSKVALALYIQSILQLSRDQRDFMGVSSGNALISPLQSTLTHSSLKQKPFCIRSRLQYFLRDIIPKLTTISILVLQNS